MKGTAQKREIITLITTIVIPYRHRRNLVHSRNCFTFDLFSSFFLFFLYRKTGPYRLCTKTVSFWGVRVPRGRAPSVHARKPPLYSSFLLSFSFFFTTIVIPRFDLLLPKWSHNYLISFSKALTILLPLQL